MQTNKNHSVSGQELDNLLKQAFLNLDVTNPKNDAMMETVAHTTLSQAVAPVAGSGKSFFSLKVILSGIGLLTLIPLLVYFLIPPDSDNKKTTPSQYSFDSIITPIDEEQEKTAPLAETVAHPLPEGCSLQKTSPPIQALAAGKEPALVPSYEKPMPVPDSAEPKVKNVDSVYAFPVVPDDSAYVFPVLTEAEIKANHKRKKRMVEQLMKLHKDRYAFIPMGSFFYGKDTLSCHAFYMQTKEVSNLEYRTFLFDLLIAGKKTEFLKAKPDQGQWNNKFGKDGYFDPMKQMYFSHPAYNDYPVVNISREGAEMYCIWLSIAVNEALREKDKPLMNDLRLPSHYEWAYAASNKANQARYANGTAQLRNSKGLYMQNYNCDTYANSRYDSIHDVYLFRKTENGKGPITDGGFFTTATGAYAPNLYGIYDLAGNVSEMVYLWDSATNKAKGFGTKGGSWASPDYFLEIDARQEFKHPEKPSPLIGFRPVMTAMLVGTLKK